LCDRHCQNGTRKVDPVTEEALRVMLRRTLEEFGFSLPTWTLELLARVAVEYLGLHLSVGHLWKILKWMGSAGAAPDPWWRVPDGPSGWPRLLNCVSTEPGQDQSNILVPAGSWPMRTKSTSI
jgi:hypothetical protein